jgi:hypothetical protein
MLWLSLRQQNPASYHAGVYNMVNSFKGPLFRRTELVNLRKHPTANENIELVAQVDNICPICSRRLLEENNGQRYKRFEVAHIYPLNPTRAEQDLLMGEERLSNDPNDLANLIPLCRSCHGSFDKPRTVAGYRKLVDFKKQALRREQERGLWHAYQLEEEVSQILQRISTSDPEEEMPTSREAMSADYKTRGAPNVTRYRIKQDVLYYFQTIRIHFQILETIHPSSSELIAQQVRAFYVAQKRDCSDKEELYNRVARWIKRRSETSEEAASILASFFVQNCEVFE